MIQSPDYDTFPTHASAQNSCDEKWRKQFLLIHTFVDTRVGASERVMKSESAERMTS